MKSINSTVLSAFITLLLMVAVVLSSLATSYIVERFEREEQKKIELWAEATRQFILADENENIDLLLQVLEGNTTIPVYMVDTAYNLLLSRNVREPKRNVDAFYVEKINQLRVEQTPIEVRISDNVMQYIYYEPSSTLRWLSYFPYIQMIVMIALASLAAIALLMVQRSEKNSLWVGLSKETAHQLGTPISSLNAWNELLKTRYPDDPLLPQMDEDIYRLQNIAERFSKIGSQPTLERMEVLPVVQSAMDYMRARTSNKVAYSLEVKGERRKRCCAHRSSNGWWRISARMLWTPWMAKVLSPSPCNLWRRKFILTSPIPERVLSVESSARSSNRVIPANSVVGGSA